MTACEFVPSMGKACTCGIMDVEADREAEDGKTGLLTPDGGCSADSILASSSPSIFSSSSILILKAAVGSCVEAALRLPNIGAGAQVVSWHMLRTKRRHMT